MVGPVVSQTLSDVFCVNEYGPNFLFKNNGDGTFTDVAQLAGKRTVNALTNRGESHELITERRNACRRRGPDAARQRSRSGRLQP